MPGHPDASMAPGRTWMERLPGRSGLPVGLLASLGLIIVVLGLAVGLWARFHQLGIRPLAVDEYYFVRSVEFIQEHGLPEIPTGGYYIRGILQQYLTAGSAFLFGESGYAYRLPSALFNLASIFLVFVYARRSLGRTLAATVALTLALSSWHIEFARFARMYSAFQCMTLLFLITLEKSCLDRDRRFRFLPHASAILLMGTHAMGVLLAPLLFLPYLLDSGHSIFPHRTSAFRYGIVSGATVVVCLLLARLDFRNSGVRDPYPDGYTPPADATFSLPSFPFWSLGETELLNLVAVCIALCLAVMIPWICMRAGKKVHPSDYVLAFVLAATVLHQFLLSLAGVLVLLFRYRVHERCRRARHVRVLLSATVAVGLAWVAFALSSRDWVAATGAHGMLEALHRTFLGWPDIYRPIYRPWSRELPLLGLLAAGSLLYQSARKMNEPLSSSVRGPVAVLLYLAFCMGVLTSEFASTRYSFFVYPVILTMVAGTLLQLMEGSMKKHAPVAAALTYALLFACSADFNPRHIAEVASERVGYRLAGYERFERTWYARYDFASPAEFLEREANEGTIVLVENPPVSYYLDREHAIYTRREGVRFRDVSRERGTIDLWSNQRLLGTPEEVRSHTMGKSPVWLIWSVRNDQQPFRLEEIWPEPEVSRAFLSADGRIEILRIEPESQGAVRALLEPASR